MTARVRGRGGLGNLNPTRRQAGTQGHGGPTRPRWRDPAALTPGERMAELGAILATGYRRLRLSLAESGQAEAPCDRSVNAKEIA